MTESEHAAHLAAAAVQAAAASAAYEHARQLGRIWGGMNDDTRAEWAAKAPALAEHLDGLADAWSRVEPEP